MSEEELTAPQQAATTVTEPEAATQPTAVDDMPLTPEAQLAAELIAAKEEAAKNLDGWLRAQAEFANARKRFEKQRAEAYQNATADVIINLLPILDDFDRALANVPAAISGDPWFEGILLVQRKLNNILETFKVIPITAVGQPFDPTLHEAIMPEESSEHPSGTVTREMQKGYRLGDRIIRPALVYVAA